MVVLSPERKSWNTSRILSSDRTRSMIFSQFARLIFFTGNDYTDLFFSPLLFPFYFFFSFSHLRIIVGFEKAKGGAGGVGWGGEGRENRANIIDVYHRWFRQIQPRFAGLQRIVTFRRAILIKALHFP